MDPEIYFETDGANGVAILQLAEELLAESIRAQGVRVESLEKDGERRFFCVVPLNLFVGLREQNVMNGQIHFAGVHTSCGHSFKVSMADFRKAFLTEAMTAGRMRDVLGFKEQGTRPAAARSGETLEGIVIDLIKADPNLTYAQALVEAQKRRPDLAQALLQRMTEEREFPKTMRERLG